VSAPLSLLGGVADLGCLCGLRHGVLDTFLFLRDLLGEAVVLPLQVG